MPRNAQGQHFAANAREGNAYLPQVSPIESFGPSGGAIYSVEYNNLPIEAKNIIRTLNSGGSVSAYRRDGSTHGNRERNLPTGGTYEEYTVSTTGRGDAAHRVVHRTDTGEFYYTGFHYADFSLVKNIP